MSFASYSRSPETSSPCALLPDREVEGFEDDPSRLARDEKVTLLIRLNKGVARKLEQAVYFTI